MQYLNKHLIDTSRTSMLILLVSTWSAAFGMFFVGVTAAQASAERQRVLHLADDLIAHTSTDFYIIRVVADNKGHEDTSVERHFLIKQDIKSGVVKRHWLVRNLDWSYEWYSDESQRNKRRVFIQEPLLSDQVGDRQKFFNPYDILRVEKAVPISPLEFYNPVAYDETWQIDAESGLVRFNKNSADRYILTGLQLDNAIFSNLKSTLKIMEDFEYTQDVLPLENPVKFVAHGSCRLVDVVNASVLSADFSHYLGIECENFDSLIKWIKVWVAI